jgi:hypothetical protein
MIADDLGRSGGLCLGISFVGVFLLIICRKGRAKRREGGI